MALPKLRQAFEVDAASISSPEPALPGQRTLWKNTKPEPQNAASALIAPA